MNVFIVQCNSSLECQPVILELTASAAFGKQNSNQKIIYRILDFRTFLLIDSLWGFIENCACMIFFFFLKDNREGLEGALSVIIMQNSLALYAQGTIGMTDTKDRDAILEGSLSCLTVLLVRVSLCTHCGFKEYDNFETVIN